MKFRLTSRWHATGIDGTRRKGEPVSEPKTVVIDSVVDRKYDGARNAEDIKRTFMEHVTPDPINHIELRIFECVRIE